MKIYNSHLIGASNVSSSMGNILYSQFTGSFKGDGSGLTNIIFSSPFSCSILPFTASGELTSFSIGSISSPWKSLNISTASLNFINDGEVYVSLTGGRNKLIITNAYIGTSSFGFDNTNPVIIRNSISDIKISVTGSVDVIGDGSKTIHRISSASFEAHKIDSDGVLVLGSFTYTPTARAGGLFYSASNLFVGS